MLTLKVFRSVLPDNNCKIMTKYNIDLQVLLLNGVKITHIIWIKSHLSKAHFEED